MAEFLKHLDEEDEGVLQKTSGRRKYPIITAEEILARFNFEYID